MQFTGTVHQLRSLHHRRQRRIARLQRAAPPADQQRRRRAIRLLHQRRRTPAASPASRTRTAMARTTASSSAPLAASSRSGTRVPAQGGVCRGIIRIWMMGWAGRGPRWRWRLVMGRVDGISTLRRERIGGGPLGARCAERDGENGRMGVLWMRRNWCYTRPREFFFCLVVHVMLDHMILRRLGINERGSRWLIVALMLHHSLILAYRFLIDGPGLTGL